MYGHAHHDPPEHYLQDALTSLRQDRTTIIVAHRCVQTGQSAVWFDGSQIKADVAHAQLSLVQAQHHHGCRPDCCPPGMQLQVGIVAVFFVYRPAEGHHQQLAMPLSPMLHCFCCSTERWSRWAGMRSCWRGRACTATCGRGSRRPPLGTVLARQPPHGLPHAWRPPQTCRAQPRLPARGQEQRQLSQQRSRKM